MKNIDQKICYHKNERSQLEYLLLLLSTTNLLFKLGTKIFELFPKISEIFTNDIDLTKLGFNHEEILNIRNPKWHLVDESLEWLQQNNCQIISIQDSHYPQILKEITNPPVLLFASGNIKLLNHHQLAIIGSRNPTPVGLKLAQEFAQALSNSGLVITSGFAIGVDAAAHRGAISSNTSHTIAVMGSGLNQLYPKRHHHLAQEIINSGGLLISEFPLNSKAQAWHFPMRNRIISGLSLGTLVIEAALKSGSLITAKLAAEQGREVFAIPGSIYNEKAKGCNYLIQQGAKLVTDLTDILVEFPQIITPPPTKINNQITMGYKNKLDSHHQKLLDCIGFELTTIDNLVAAVDLHITQIRSILLDLELQGWIANFMGCYIRLR